MDIDGLRAVLEGIRSGAIKTIAVDTPVPSQFSHEILNANPYAYLDDAPLEERRARAVQMRRTLPQSVLEEVGKLDPAAVAQVRDESKPDVRDADELHDVMQTLVALPVPTALGGWELLTSHWERWLGQLLEHRRAVLATAGDQKYWVASERAKAFKAIFTDAQFEQEPPDVGGDAPSRDDAMLQMLAGWMMHAGPVTSAGLAEVLGVTEGDVDRTMLRMESTGAVLRGKFTEAAFEASALLRSAGQVGAPAPTQDIVEWCDRRLLARIHRLTVATLRKQIEPVTRAQYMRWLLRWQHVAPGTQLSGERGLLEALRQLQGFEIPANAWERQVLARRVREYDPAELDQLCMTGAVGWGRLSPHPATIEESDGKARRIVPTSVAPVTFFVREESDWMVPRKHGEEEERGLSETARVVLEFLRKRGASFFADIVRGTDKLKAEIETGLWELVAAGYVTADGFDNLRSLIDPKRRAGQGHGKVARPRHAAGRWSLLNVGEELERNRQVESTCWMLLKRYGVVFRDVLAREANLPKWRELQVAFRRLEDRGEIRGGRFVAGFVGEQFALPVAVEFMREIKRVEPSGETITVSAADPLNLVGIVVPGERVPAISGKTVTFRDGVAYEAQEERVVVPIREVAGD
jgi:ATP-dependent helicase Lhr and Lhr-like helicase